MSKYLVISQKTYFEMGTSMVSYSVSDTLEADKLTEETLERWTKELFAVQGELDGFGVLAPTRVVFLNIIKLDD